MVWKVTKRSKPIRGQGSIQCGPTLKPRIVIGENEQWVQSTTRVLYSYIFTGKVVR